MAGFRTVILAAGAATRLRPLTNATPKALLPVAGVPMLERSIRHLEALGCDDLVIVTGFSADTLRAAVGTWATGATITWVHNDAWATTNNSVSLWLSRPHVDGRPFLLLDSDLVYERGVLEVLLRSPHTDALALREGVMGAEEIKVETDARGRVTAIGKHLRPEAAAGESVGIERFSAAGGAAMFGHLDRRVRARGLVNEWYEASWQDWIHAGGEIHAVPVAPHFCAEVDTIADLELVSERLAARALRDSP